MIQRIDRRNLAILSAFSCAVVCGTAVNFLAKRAALDEPPIALNGWRTLVAAVILGLVMLAWRSPFRSTKRELIRYFVIAALAMAIPHALIFVALRNGDASETTLAFAEAAVLGVVMVYLFASSKRFGWLPVMCVLSTFAGLALFLGIRPGDLMLNTGDMIALFASLSLGFGLIIDAWTAPRSSQQLVSPSVLDKCRLAVKKTFFTCLFSGCGTLLILAVASSASGQQHVRIPAADSWQWIAVLAVVGSCLTWLSMFTLIAFEKLELAAAVIAAVPVTTELANYVWFTPTVATSMQWFGGLVVLMALGILIRVQLVKPTRERSGTQPLTGEVNVARLPASSSNAEAIEGSVANPVLEEQ